MNFVVALTTLALVIPAELPDKTFISCIVLASRFRPLPVWIGTTGGLVIQAGLAVVAGKLLSLLPHPAVEGVVAGLFLAGAAYLLLVPEKAEQEKGERIAMEADDAVGDHAARDAMADEPGDGTGAPAAGAAAAQPTAESVPEVGAKATPEAAAAVRIDLQFWKAMLTALSVVTLAEFGDITQVLIANLSAKYKDALSVFVGAAVGFAIVTAFGVVTGRTLTRIVPLSLIRKLSGVVLAGFGVYTLVTLLRG